MSAPRVVLVGLPGAGKSTTGRRLAKILGVPFADSDDLVEAAHGRGVRQIFAESGEQPFRELERDAVIGALAAFPGVLSLGGGALICAQTRTALLRSGVPVVFLEAPVATLTARVGDGRTRPLLSEDPAGRLTAMAEQRRPLYVEVATLHVDTASRTPGQVASLIAARLHERSVRS
jgi:shikimate kinase